MHTSPTHYVKLAKHLIWFPGHRNIGNKKVVKMAKQGSRKIAMPLIISAESTEIKTPKFTCLIKVFRRKPQGVFQNLNFAHIFGSFEEENREFVI